MQNLSKQIKFDNLIYHFKNKNTPKKIVVFKAPLGLDINIKDGYTTVKKEEEKQKEFESDLSEIR